MLPPSLRHYGDSSALPNRGLEQPVLMRKAGLIFITAVIAALTLGSLGECDKFSLEYELLYHPVPQFKPSWTPDGSRIVFDKYVIDSSGTNIHSFVPGSQAGGALDYLYSPNVSPDGTRVTYMTLRHGNGFPGMKTHSWDIVTSSLDGSNYERLTPEESFESNPVWAPDGKRIAFFSDRDTPYWYSFNLFVMDKDGSNVRNLTPSIPTVQQPAVWSPDGTKIAYWALEESTSEDCQYDNVLSIVGLDGSNLRRVSAKASHLTWSPDSKKLAFIVSDLDNPSDTPPAVAIVALEGNGEIEQYSVEPGPESPEDRISYFGPRALAWSMDGSSLLLVARHGREFKIYSLRPDVSSSSGLVGRFPTIGSRQHTKIDFAWSPDRSRLAVWEYSTDASDPSFVDPLHTVALHTIAADGSDFKTLATRTEDGSMAAANVARESN